MPSYNRLTADNRIELYALNKAGLKQNAIAAQLNVSPSTISRELRRNSGLRGYLSLLNISEPKSIGMT